MGGEDFLEELDPSVANSGLFYKTTGIFLSPVSDESCSRTLLIPCHLIQLDVLYLI